jgi:DNA-directed RNA polymerase II subunit RPB7
MIFVEPIIMDPSSLGREVENLIRAELVEKVQGSVSLKYGYIVCVMKILKIGQGKVLDTTGNVIFNVEYKAVVMKPMINELMEGVVEKVESYGVNVTAGLLRKIFISSNHFPGDFVYDENTNSFKSKDLNEEVKVDSEIRFRVTAINYEMNQFLCTGTMNEAYLGLTK